MKIEIDLNDIMGGDDRGETLQESIRRQVIDTMVKRTREGVEKQISVETSRVINESLAIAMRDQMPTLINDLMNAEFTPVDRYGNRSKPTTFRAELIQAINAEMKYEKRQYSSDKNAFTAAVDAVVGENLTAFKTEFHKLINADFMTQAMAHATAKLAERLGIAKG